MSRTDRWTAAAVAVLLGAGTTAILGMPPSTAGFTATTSNESAQFGADVLAPATGLGLTADCAGGSPVVTVEWTPSASAYADGYTVTRVNGGSTVNAGTATPGTADELDDTTANAATAYTYTVRSYFGSWTSAGVSATVTPGACAPATNVVANPGFETGLGPWTCTPVPDGTQDGTQQNTGSFSLQLVGPGTACRQTVTVTVTTNYRLVFSARNSPGSGCGVTGRVVEQGQSRRVINSSGWLKPPGAPVGEAAGVSMTVEFTNDASCSVTDTNWVDDVVLS